jgi:cytochrome b involved in lipid metabolism
MREASMANYVLHHALIHMLLGCQLVHSCHSQALRGPRLVPTPAKSSPDAVTELDLSFYWLLVILSQQVTMADKTFTLDECKKHVSDKDCWLVVHGKVYNVTDFLEEHPGGYDIILTSAGDSGRQAATCQVLRKLTCRACALIASST